ncbi:hypothetical protein KIN20_020721 [Parelaphostrongylus tenuis]|uniref:Transmembrane protein n=1 Tax=Parelaphostrongylus tenuis TaxID=148309 RepID=A0AAD5N3H5_PARTN|nr:hypothetical protein KIN20_020721 [Parelaphostrongylus tenuis]
MNRVLNWIRSRSDHNVVSYSRFGLPGDELDDRPPPTVIHVAPFREDSEEFMAFGTHSQRAAVISAGVGLSLVLFIFLSVFFEFDWYHHEKGVDIGALVGLLLFLLVGVAIHWHVIRGIKTGQPKYLVPFIIVYAMTLVVEAVFFIFVVNHIVVLNYLKTVPPQSTSGYLFVTAMFVFTMAVQGVMLTAVVRCRNYLEKRQIHDLELRVAEKSKLQHPGIRIVFGPGDAEMNSPAGVDLRPSTDEAPPSYEHATQPANGTTQPEAPAPQRTVLQAQDGIL